MGKISLAIGLGAGYVLGARAGRDSYDRIAQRAQELWGHPKVQEAAGQVRDKAGVDTGSDDTGSDDTAHDDMSHDDMSHDDAFERDDQAGLDDQDPDRGLAEPGSTQESGRG